jgi:hypothetical protein
VISQNLHRRHLTTGQRAEIAESMATGTHGGVRKSDQEQKIAFDQPTLKQAAKMMHVSDQSVKQVRKVRREAPEKIKAIKAGKLAPSKAARQIEEKKSKRERKGKLLNGDDAGKAFDEQDFNKLVLGGIKRLFKRIDRKREQAAKRLVVNDWFSLFHSTKGDVMPEYVIYADGTKFKVDEVLRSRAGLRLQSDKSAPIKAVKSHDVTAALGHAPRKKGGAE